MGCTIQIIFIVGKIRQEKLLVFIVEQPAGYSVFI